MATNFIRSRAISSLRRAWPEPAPEPSSMIPSPLPDKTGISSSSSSSKSCMRAMNAVSITSVYDSIGDDSRGARHGCVERALLPAGFFGTAGKRASVHAPHKPKLARHFAHQRQQVVFGVAEEGHTEVVIGHAGDHGRGVR